MNDADDHFFVYGTLMRGQCRQSLWPRPPRSVTPALVRGQLYDLGEYPALRIAADDNDWVEGELWKIAAADVAVTLARLDEIEETNQPGRPNLYDRLRVEVHLHPTRQRGTGPEKSCDSDRSLTLRAGRGGACLATDPSAIIAWTYMYACPLNQAIADRVLCGAQGVARWRAH